MVFEKGDTFATCLLFLDGQSDIKWGLDSLQCVSQNDRVERFRVAIRFVSHKIAFVRIDRKRPGIDIDNAIFHVVLNIDLHIFAIVRKDRDFTGSGHIEAETEGQAIAQVCDAVDTVEEIHR